MICINVLAALAIISNLPTTVIHAAVTPPALGYFASARVGSNFYIQSGISLVNNIITLNSTTLYSLDLSTSWSTSSPPWTSLGDGPTPQALSSAVYGNNQTFVSVSFTANPSVYHFTPYSVKTGKWGTAFTATNTTVNDILQYGVMPVADPTTGLLYIPGVVNMNVLDLNTFVWKTATAIPGGLLTSRYWGAGVYNPSRKTIMYTGGYNFNIAITNFDTTFLITEYTPMTGGWSTLTTGSTNAPSPMANHCAALSEDGKVLVVFGGRLAVSNPGTFTNTIHLLNITTAVWTLGAAYQTPMVLGGCMIIGDQFLFWGGGPNGTDTTKNTAPSIFNMTSLTWVTTYTPPAYYLSTPNNTANNIPSASNTPPPTTTTTKSLNTGIIIGVVVGVLVIGSVVGFVVFRRRRQQRVEQTKKINDQEDKLKVLVRSNENHSQGSSTIGDNINNNSTNNSTNSVAGEYLGKTDPVSYPRPPPRPTWASPDNEDGNDSESEGRIRGPQEWPAKKQEYYESDDDLEMSERNKLFTNVVRRVNHPQEESPRTVGSPQYWGYS